MRFGLLDRPPSRAMTLVLSLWLATTFTPTFAADAVFDQFLQALWPQAQQQGVSRTTFDTAISGLEPDMSLPDLALPGRREKQPQQPEFVQTPADYVRESTIARLAGRGKQLLAAHRTTLDAIERQFGVQPSVILAIWGRETDFGGIGCRMTPSVYSRRKPMSVAAKTCSSANLLRH